VAKAGMDALAVVYARELPEQLAELYDVNVLSTQRMNRAALPQLRKQKQGLVYRYRR
jgi:NADP-dependent 3-hydroxy acid dehydrogenase YdfG